ncbi:MAG: hypothetical protein MJY71_01730 [Bacteroidaceae bacterium]|nr:hypothetical protein [Bacteroidaceae bacterium]
MKNNWVNNTGESPFRVPDGYFEKLPEQIMAALPKDGCNPFLDYVDKKVYRPVFYKRRRFMYSVASVALLLVFFSLAHYVKDCRRSANHDAIVFSDEFIDNFLEESMVDEYLMYSSLIDGEQENIGSH